MRHEGSDEAAATAAFFCMSKCVERFKAGITMNGNPFISFNAFTNRWEFLYVKKRFGLRCSTSGR